MTQEKPVTLSYTERIELSSAARLISEASEAPGAEGRAALLQVVEAECGQIARSIVQDLHADIHTAEADADSLRARVSEARARFDDANQQANEVSRHGSWIKVAIWSIFAVACFAAEFVLTWTALCFVLNVPRMTVLGVLLGLAPPSGLAVLEIVLARLFEEPWQKLRRETGSGKKLAINVVMGILLMSLAAGNAVMITHLAKAREESAKLQRILSDPASTGTGDVDQGAIDTAILLVSVLVSVDGAVFLLLSLGEGAALAGRSRLQRRLVNARAAWELLEGAETGLKARVGALREDLRTADHKAALAAERYRAHCRFLTAQKDAAERLRPIDELVDRAFRKRLAA